MREFKELSVEITFLQDCKSLTLGEAWSIRRCQQHFILAIRQLGQRNYLLSHPFMAS